MISWKSSYSNSKCKATVFTDPYPLHHNHLISINPLQLSFEENLILTMLTKKKSPCTKSIFNVVEYKGEGSKSKCKRHLANYYYTCMHIALPSHLILFRAYQKLSGKLHYYMTTNLYFKFPRHSNQAH